MKCIPVLELAGRIQSAATEPIAFTWQLCLSLSLAILANGRCNFSFIHSNFTPRRVLDLVDWMLGLGLVISGEEQFHAVMEVIVKAFFDCGDGIAFGGISVADCFFFGAHFFGEGSFHFHE